MRPIPTTTATAQVKATVARDPLAMQIYAAMLGDQPRIDPHASASRPRLRMRVRLEARVEHVGTSPFRRPTLLEHVERCAAYAAVAIDEARERLAESRPKPMAKLAEVPPDVAPIVLIGATVRRAVERQASRAA